MLLCLSVIMLMAWMAKTSFENESVAQISTITILVCSIISLVVGIGGAVIAVWFHNPIGGLLALVTAPFAGHIVISGFVLVTHGDWERLTFVAVSHLLAISGVMIVRHMLKKTMDEI